MLTRRLFTTFASLVITFVSVFVAISSLASAETVDSFTHHNVHDIAYIERLKQRPGKVIEVILEEQRLVAWEDGRMVLSTLVSTGTRRTPTPHGTFRIYRKFERQRMVGRDFDLPNAPYVMYFRKGGYAIHGTYWHNNFGQSMSHGCINLPTGSAAWLYQWAPSGTTVVVH